MQVEPFLVLFAALAITTLARVMIERGAPRTATIDDPSTATNEHA